MSFCAARLSGPLNPQLGAADRHTVQKDLRTRRRSCMCVSALFVSEEAKEARKQATRMTCLAGCVFVLWRLFERR